MQDKDLDLNSSPPLRDGTAASQSGGFTPGVSAAQLRSGVVPVAGDAEPFWTDDENTPTPLDGVKSESRDEVGGFLKRPFGQNR